MLQYYFPHHHHCLFIGLKTKKKAGRTDLDLINAFSTPCISECTEKLYQMKQLGLQHNNCSVGDFINQSDYFQTIKDLFIYDLRIIAFALSRMFFLSTKKT